MNGPDLGEWLKSLPWYRKLYIYPVIYTFACLVLIANCIYRTVEGRGKR